MPSTEWLIERGIGETRMARVENGEIVEARILLDGVVHAGSIVSAQLKQVRPRTVAEAEGQEYLLPKGAPGVSEGASIAIEVTREAIPGGEPWKRPLARVTNAAPGPVPDLAGRSLAFPAPNDELEKAGWSDLLEEARSGIVRFEGGELRVSPTPAMTLIDVDGFLPPFELAMTGARAASRTILRHGIGGSIGIDFPTVPGKDQRNAIGETVDVVLPKPFERTAVNGFGFLQIVRPRTHASLFELAADREAFETRSLLRRAVRETGAIRLAAHPAVISVLETKLDWTQTLARQVGGAVALRSDPGLSISGGHVEKA